MRIWKQLFLSLILILFLLILSIFSIPDKKVHLIACDVGQGDTTLVIQGNMQILIDGGPTNKVLDCLGEYIPFWDRKIEMIILTHPDFDHYAGLTEVFRRYDVENYLTNGFKSSNQSYKALESEVGGRGMEARIARKGTDIRYGKIYLDILSPEETIKEGESNDSSLIISLKYADFEAILTGDAPKEILNTINLNSHPDYIKLSHHGSKTGTDGFTLDNFVPKLAVISVGKNNYGHPSQEVLQLLNERKIQTLRTDELGNIEVISDGKSFWIKY